MNLWRAMGLEGKRVIIVHHDDLGYTEAQNRAYLELGYPTGSVLTPGAWAMQVRTGDLGVHLTLTSEWECPRMRPLTAGPSLRDAEGYLWRTLPEVWANVTAEEAEVEFRAQIDLALRLGIDVTHIDTHMGAIGRPDLAMVYQRLAADYGLLAVLPDAETLNRTGLPADWVAALNDLPDLTPMPRIRLLDAYSGATAQRTADYIDLLTKQGPGVYHFIHHAAAPTAEGRALPDWEGRNADMEALSDPEFKRVLGEFTLLTYRKVRDALRTYR